MPNNFDYTTRARKLYFRYPVLTYIGTQINYWVLAFLLLSFVLHMNTLTINEITQNDIPASISSAIVLSIIIGVLFGIVLGLIDLFIERRFFNRLTIGIIFLSRTIIYPILLFGVVSFIRYILWDLIINPYYPDDFDLSTTNTTWRYFTLIVLVYTIFMTVGITFINQMNLRFGPGVLIPLLLGRYRKPKEQDRFFMFLDMKSSTHHAESLGHLKYSELVRDCFMDINQAAKKANAEIYQYVGDEVVLTWLYSEGVNNASCLDFYFLVQEILNNRREHYQYHFEVMPEFAAGLHFGVVTAVEVGEIKRDIAYHGDTINTAARIQGLCNEYQKSILITGRVKDAFKDSPAYKFESLGDVNLKGKGKMVELFGIIEKPAYP